MLLIQCNRLYEFIENDSLKNLHQANVILQQVVVVFFMSDDFTFVDFKPLCRILVISKDVMSSQSHYNFRGDLEDNL
jgi:hypothetical protein